MPGLNQNNLSAKSRVHDHGEVFTQIREVNDMLHLVGHEAERIESRFFEPACGDGNFLSEIMRRKLETVIRRYKRSKLEYERSSITAVASVYGVDILQDNVITCQLRLLDIFIDYYRATCKKQPKNDLIDSVRFILDHNILWGDALTLRTPDSQAKPIIFSEWSRPFNDSYFKRRDYHFHELTPLETKNLFSENIISDTGEIGFIPRSIKEYPLTHFLKLGAVQ